VPYDMIIARGSPGLVTSRQVYSMDSSFLPRLTKRRANCCLPLHIATSSKYSPEEYHQGTHSCVILRFLGRSKYDLVKLTTSVYAYKKIPREEVKW